MDPVLEERWLPKSILSLRGYTPQKFLRDLVAGITVGLVALPLAMAILCGAREQPRQLIHQAEFEELIGKENFCDNVQEALQRAEEVFESLPPAAKAVPVGVG